MLRMLFNKSNDSRKKVATSNITLDYIFGINEFFDVILLFLLQDERFVFIEKVVGIIEFWCNVKSGNSFGVGWIGLVRKIKVFGQMIDRNLGKKRIDTTLLIEIGSNELRNFVMRNGLFLTKQNLPFNVFKLILGPFVAS